MSIRRVLVLALGTLALSQSGVAQPRSNTSKLFVSFGANGSSINSDDLDQDSRGGPGLQIGFGYGFKSRFAIFLDASAASIDDGSDNDYTLSHIDLGVRYHFGSTDRAFRPYIEAAFTGRTAALDDQTIEGNDDVDVDISGPAFTLGGGILYFFNSRWAFNAHAKWSTGEFSRVRVENVTIDGLDFDANTARLGIGLSWFFQGNR